MREHSMQPFEFQLPTRIRFGNGVARDVGEEAQRLGGRALVVTDPGVKDAGLLDGILASLSAAAVEAVIFDSISANPRDTEVLQGVGLAKAESCDVLVAVGGGSVIDAAKGIGTILTHGGRVQDYEGLDKLTTRITPLIAVPTTHGTGSEVTFWYVISDVAEKRKVDGGSPLMAAWVALVDPEMTLSLPPGLTAATGLDALTHAVEAYTCTIAEPLTDCLALNAIGLIARSIRTAHANGRDLDARCDMMLASLLAGVAFGNSDVAAVHCISETLGGYYDIPHGVANAIYLPIVADFNSMALPERYAAIAGALGGNIAGLSAIEAARLAGPLLQSLSADLNIPTAKEVGVRDEDLPVLAAIAARNVSVESNPRAVGEEAFLEILKVAQAG
jgi:alcohol dehydrogenase